jgi:di/tricarboxylate transporter
MNWHSALTLAVVVGTIYVLARNVVRPALALLAANFGLFLFGVISSREAFAGFSNAAPFTVAALYVLARAVEKTGAMQPLIDAALKGGETGRVALARLLAPVAGSSAFLNNTPIVAMLVPAVSQWAERRGKSASPYLMPLSFATILGGTITVIGTSTNLLVSGLMEHAGMAPIGMFEITAVGLPVAFAGVGVLVMLTPVLLPNRRPAREQFHQDVREYVTSASVVPAGALDGRTVEAGGLRELSGVFLVEIERDGHVIAPAAPTTTLRGGDVLVFAGRSDTVRDLQTMRGLALAEQKHALDFNCADHTFFEAVVSGAGSLAGRTLKERDFRSSFQAAVLAIHRAGERVKGKLGAIPLKEGDTLLLVADRGFARRWRDRNEFLLVSQLGGSPPPSTRQAFLVGLIAIGVIVLAGVGLLPILQASMLGAFALVAARVLSPGEARSAIDMDVVLMIAASFGVGSAIEKSGLADTLGSFLVGSLSSFGPLAVLAAVCVATVVVTEIITNNAAAVLMLPIAFAAAAELRADPRPFAMTVAVAASASFLTPIGYQTNTMVYGPGGYRFGDYVRLGAPLTAVVIATTLLVVPIFWPL